MLDGRDTNVQRCHAIAAALVLLGACATTPAPTRAGRAVDPVTPQRADATQLVSISVARAPTLDGELADEAWRAAPALDVIVRRRFGPPAEREIVVSLRSVHVDGRVYFAATWPDPSESASIKPWIWNAEAKRYEEGSDREDMFALAFPLSGPFVADMLAPVDATWDVWQWKAFRTNPEGFAMDKTHRTSRTPFAGKVASHTANDGSTIWIARPDDEGEPLYTKRPAPAEFAGDRVEQYWPSAASGSAADVRAKAKWRAGRWTLELGRALATGHDDDAPLVVGESTRILVATFDATGEMDRGSDVVAFSIDEGAAR